MSTEKQIKIGVIPAGGKGTRLGFLSALLPKTLCPLYDRPILHYVINQMENLGIEDIYVIVHARKEAVFQYIKMIEIDLKARIHFIEQPTLDGTANAIALAEKYTKDQPFMVIYGDDCTVAKSLDPMVGLFFEKNPVVVEGAVQESEVKILQQTCSLNLEDDGRMIEIIEKPEHPPYHVRGCGVYLFSPKIYDYIRKTPVHPVRLEKEITYTINSAAKDGEAYAFTIEGSNVNINDYNELLKASLLVKAQSHH
ncbi:MAG TPA: nucleotidyltransferase family protein [bacterium]|nr:nucleotidyltransferase family protein [bacterium]